MPTARFLKWSNVHTGIRSPPPPWTGTPTHKTENITLPQTSYASGKNNKQTRMLSSRMRTVRCSGRREISDWGCLPGGCVFQHALGREVSAPVHAGMYPLVDRILDTRLWKHYLSTSTMRTVTTSLNVLPEIGFSMIISSLLLVLLADSYSYCSDATVMSRFSGLTVSL